MIKGLLRRFLVEPRSGLFIGVVSRRVAEFLWESLSDLGDIEPEGFRAFWLLGNSMNEQGYEMREHGGRMSLEDFDGLLLPQKSSQ